jgi:hypothetical protein
VLADVSGWYEPGAQYVQVDASAAEKRPVWHAVHRDEPATENVPAAHGEAELMDVAAQKYPAVHATQSTDEPAGWNVPTAQGVHRDAYARDAVPAAHARHAELPAAAYEPPAHA